VTQAYNLGIGKGFSVKELINAFETASGLKINAVVTERRPFNIDAPRMEAG
jgi:UDP-glucose 4-epimerase